MSPTVSCPTSASASPRPAVAQSLSHEGHVGVIAADDLIDAVRAALPRSERLELVASTAAKGLEFDHVVLVEPAGIIAAHDGATGPDVGLRNLYVALTRAVARLTIVHAQPLPPVLAMTSAAQPESTVA